jgi:dirigent-like protein
VKKLSLIVAVVLALAGAAVAYAAGSGGRSTTTILHFHEPAANASFLDVGGKGTTQGDYLAWDDQLRDVASGKFVGHVAGVCTLVDLRSQLFDCSPVTYMLAGGTIYVDGLFSGKGVPETDPIVGGTGKYQGVHGTATVKPLSATLTDHVITIGS